MRASERQSGRPVGLTRYGGTQYVRRVRRVSSTAVRVYNCACNAPCAVGPRWALYRFYGSTTYGHALIANASVTRVLARRPSSLGAGGSPDGTGCGQPGKATSRRSTRRGRGTAPQGGSRASGVAERPTCPRSSVAARRLAAKPGPGSIRFENPRPDSRFTLY